MNQTASISVSNMAAVASCNLVDELAYRHVSRSREGSARVSEAEEDSNEEGRTGTRPTDMAERMARGASLDVFSFFSVICTGSKKDRAIGKSPRIQAMPSGLPISF